VIYNPLLDLAAILPFALALLYFWPRKPLRHPMRDWRANARGRR
jgi:hypothetical protein